MTTASGVILAAGASVRMGSPKALATIGGADGATMLEATLAALVASGVVRPVVVVAPPHGDDIVSAGATAGALVAWNREPRDGMLASARVGLAMALADRDSHVVVLALVDHPRVRPATIVRLVERACAERADLVRPRYAGRRGHPVVLGRPFAERVAEARAGTLRDALVRAPIALDVDVPDAAVLDDVDDKSALVALR